MRLLDEATFGAFLRELRLERMMTIRELADAAGLHHETLNKLEQGWHKPPPVEQILALMDGLHERAPLKHTQMRFLLYAATGTTRRRQSARLTVSQVERLLASPSARRLWGVPIGEATDGEEPISATDIAEESSRQEQARKRSD